MDGMIQISVLAMVAVICGMILKKQVPEFSLVLTWTTGGLLFLLIFQPLQQGIAFLNTLADTAGLSPAVLTPVIKGIGVSILTKITSDLCKDGGESGIAAVVDLAGTVITLVIALPLLQSVLAMMLELQQ